MKRKENIHLLQKQYTGCLEENPTVLSPAYATYLKEI